MNLLTFGNQGILFQKTNNVTKIIWYPNPVVMIKGGFGKNQYLKWMFY